MHFFFIFFAKKFAKGQMINVSLHRISETVPLQPLGCAVGQGQKFGKILICLPRNLHWTSSERAPNNHHTPSTTEFLPNSALNIQPPHHGQMIFEILLTFGFVHRLHAITRSLQLGNQTIFAAQIDGIQADKRLALSQIRLQPPHPSPVAVTIDLMVRK